ncbi:hypothetical protein [Sorangium cellulosum]|uniref:hypothetical protein n=1 Tax=Sorangium cellulosum TaxID=56 RepID=UPI000CF4F16D|nr:hypothetical protein [Sorangium cellulosum]
MRPRGSSLARAAFLAVGVCSCSRTTAEPEPPPPAVSSAPGIEPLRWDVPGGWTALDVPRGGPQKAVYRVPRSGDDKDDAEVHVLWFGLGSKGDVEANFKEWFSQFDGDVGARARRGAFEVRGLRVETVEASGTYAIALGPKAVARKRAPVEMVKDGYRLLGAAVRTPDRGTWFFRMVGPDETVQSARSALRILLESVR